MVRVGRRTVGRPFCKVNAGREANVTREVSVFWEMKVFWEVEFAREAEALLRSWVWPLVASFGDWWGLLGKWRRTGRPAEVALRGEGGLGGEGSVRGGARPGIGFIGSGSEFGRWLCLPGWFMA